MSGAREQLRTVALDEINVYARPLLIVHADFILRFTRHTDYALRVLIYAGLKGEEQSTIAEIAARYRISENHLMKVVHHLGLGGYVATTRGRKGGLRLARPPEEISIGDVVRWCEEDLRIVECLDPATNTCPIIRFCGLTQTVGEALEAFLAVLDDKTLADVLASSRGVERALQLTEPG